ncbi:MAG: thioredoxin [Christensenellales bacterium]
MENIKHLTKENFESEVMQSALPVLVDFWAPWCGPCRMVGPLVEEVANEYAGKAKVGKINIDEQEELAVKFRVMSIPTLIVFKGGKAVDTVVGAVPKAKLASMLDGALS